MSSRVHWCVLPRGNLSTPWYVHDGSQVCMHGWCSEQYFHALFPPLLLFHLSLSPSPFVFPLSSLSPPSVSPSFRPLVLLSLATPPLFFSHSSSLSVIPSCAHCLTDFISPCGECYNGICDYASEECVCAPLTEGERCDSSTSESCSCDNSLRTA